MKTNDFKIKVLPLKDNLFRVSYRITHDADRSRQIVQDVMLKLWDQRNKLEIIDNLPAYCMMLTRNLSLKECVIPFRYENNLFMVG